MLLNIKKFLGFIRYKKLYSDSRISFGASIQENSTLENNVRIEKGTFVRNSFLGKNVILHRDCYISNSNLEKNIRICSKCVLNDVDIGAYSYVCEESKISRTKIGKFCSIGFHVICGRGIHPTNFISTSPVFFSTNGQCGISFAEKDSFAERREINIGNDVWIGDMVFIKDGIQIGNGAIIGAGAVVVKDVPNYAIVAGVPARFIRFRFSEDVIRELLEIQWWNWDEERLRKAQSYFIQKDIQSFMRWVRCSS